jgi:glycosyltransferase involved in cell wall biosynthesis
MTEEWEPTTEPLVLHVIPTAAARGAQRVARDLADRLDAPGVVAHRVLTLFDGSDEVRADFSLHRAGGDSPSAGYRPTVAAKLRSILRRLDPALLVAHGGDPLKYLVPAMVGGRRPLIYCAIGTFAGPRDRRLQVTLWSRLARSADAIVAVGHEVASECTGLLGVPVDRVVMIPNGRDAAEFHPRPDGGGTTAPMVTFVGALTDGKRPDRFVEVIAALRTQGLACHAQLIGDGPLHGALVELCERARVELLGARPDVAELLRRGDLLVFPSRPAGEGLPGVLVEAGLTALPVVATDVPGVRTIVEDGRTGLVVPEDDLPALVGATGRLVQEADLRSAMGRAARQRCQDLFSIDVVVGRWRALIDPMLPTV